MIEVIKAIIRWAVTTRMLSVPRRYIDRVVSYAHVVRNEQVICTNDSKSIKVFRLIDQIRECGNILQGDMAAYFIYMATKKSAKVQGDIAEVGVYKGGTAKLICEAKGDRVLHLFDTFEGLPEIGDNDDGCQFKKGFATSALEDTKSYLGQYINVYFYKGLFPETSIPVKDKMFSFVHLDVDLYQSTKDCIEFFYPRMNKGGIIISHDYITAKGVKKAFGEFFQDKPEIIFELPNNEQCLVIKL